MEKNRLFVVSDARIYNVLALSQTSFMVFFFIVIFNVKYDNLIQ